MIVLGSDGEVSLQQAMLKLPDKVNVRRKKDDAPTMMMVLLEITNVNGAIVIYAYRLTLLLLVEG